MIISQSEAFTPKKELLSIVRNVIDDIRNTSLELPSWFDHFASVHLHRIAFDVDLIRNNTPPGCSLLDVGSLPLMLTGSLQRIGFKVTGLDISPERMQSAISGLELTIHKCNVETDKLPLPDRNFDGVIFNEVFEHLRINPIDTVAELRRVISIGGQLYLSTPNHLSLLNVHRMISKGRSMDSGIFDEFEKLKLFGSMGHVREYTPGDMIDFLKRMGFRIDKLTYRGRYGSNLAQTLVRLKPSLRPFFSIVATRVS